MDGIFAEVWNEHYPGQAPAGYLLRVKYPNRWVRFHSLPESKRYPETEAEYATLLERASTVAGEYFAPDQDCWMVASLREHTHRRFKKRWKRDVCLPNNLQSAFKWTLDDPDEDDSQFVAFAGLCRWSKGAFDHLIRKIADDTYRHVLWMAPSTGITFAPYDGGADLILPCETDVVSFKAKYAAWLSHHPEGL